jgi:hypothetical protein
MDAEILERVRAMAQERTIVQNESLQFQLDAVELSLVPVNGRFNPVARDLLVNLLEARLNSMRGQVASLEARIENLRNGGGF